jgi:hypothetical protein
MSNFSCTTGKIVLHCMLIHTHTRAHAHTHTHIWIEYWKTKNSAPYDSKHFLTSVWYEFYMHVNMICWGYSQIFELFHTFICFITYPYVVILSCNVVISLDVSEKEDISCFYWELNPRSSSASLVTVQTMLL